MNLNLRKERILNFLSAYFFKPYGISGRSKLNNGNKIVKEFLEKLEKEKVEFVGMSKTIEKSLEDCISKYRLSIQKFGNTNKITRSNERSLYKLISKLRIGGNIKYKG